MVIYYQMFQSLSITINVDLRVSINGGTPKLYQIIHFKGLFHHTPSILGYPHYGNPHLYNHPGKRMKSAIWHFLGNYMELWWIMTYVFWKWRSMIVCRVPVVVWHFEASPATKTWQYAHHPKGPWVTSDLAGVTPNNPLCRANGITS